MARLSTFRIPFSSFGNGIHEFDYAIDDSFFSFFEESELRHGQLKVKVLMDKSDRQLVFDLTLTGEVEVICDRCLDSFMQKIEASYTLYGKFGEGNSEEEFDVAWIPRNEHEIDLADYIFEYILLSLPLKRIHPVDDEGNSGCDQDMIKRLDEIVVISDE